MTIPDDIMQIAKEVVDRIAKVHVFKGDCVEDVANAISAERERSRQLLSEAEKREREARAKAVEEAAKVAEEMPLLRPVSTSHVKTNTPKDVAAAIRALLSEERG